MHLFLIKLEQPQFLRAILGSFGPKTPDQEKSVIFKVIQHLHIIQKNWKFLQTDKQTESISQDLNFEALIKINIK